MNVIKLEQHDADWLRKHCVCDEVVLACPFCRIAGKIEQYIALELSQEVQRRYPNVFKLLAEAEREAESWPEE